MEALRAAIEAAERRQTREAPADATNGPNSGGAAPAHRGKTRPEREMDSSDGPAGARPADATGRATRDPALTARILKVVNSAFYGMPGRIGSVQRAILVLGMRGVKNLAIAASLGALFGDAAICEGFVARDLWVHSIAVAVAAQELARATKLAAPDEAFLAALVHDIGLLAALQARPAELQAVCELASPR